MIIIKIDEKLKEIGRTRYWLSKQTDCNTNTIVSLANCETTSIRFETLEKICKVLNCSPNDIIEFK